jgi:hypothetical protein
MDVYSHIIESVQEDARMLLDGIMPEGKKTVLGKITAI